MNTQKIYPRYSCLPLLLYFAASLGWGQEALTPAPDANSVVVVPSADVLAQEESTAEAQQGGNEEVELLFPDATTTSIPGEVSGTEDTITINFPEEEIRVILRSVADLFDLNLIIPQELTGTTSVKLKDVTWAQVFEVVLEPVGYTFLEEQNIIKVRAISDLQQEPMVSDVFIVNYSDAASMQGSLASFIDQEGGGNIEINAQANALIVTERPSKIADLRRVLFRLDQPTSQVMIESKFIEVSDRDQKNLGVNWSSLGGYGVTAGPFSSSITENITNTADRARNRSVDDLSYELDAYGNVTDVYRSTNIPGIGAVGPTFTETGGVVTLEDLGPTTTSSDGRTYSRAASNTAVFSADAFSVVLSALKSFSDTKLVSNPTVVTMDNQEALISIGEKYPIPNYERNSETGALQVSGFDFERIGINLRVKTNVNSEGMINLDIKPEVSTRDGEVLFDGTSIPIIGTRETQSNVTIKDGYTLAIGGLMQETTNDSSNSVPVLGDLPVLGRLFSSETLDTTQRNLLIFVTAKTLNPDGTDYREVVSYRQLNQMKLSPSDIPGYDVPEDLQARIEDMYEMRGNAIADQLREKLGLIDEAEVEVAEPADHIEVDPLAGEPVRDVNANSSNRSYRKRF